MNKSVHFSCIESVLFLQRGKVISPKVLILFPCILIHMSVLSLSHTHLHHYLPTACPSISDCKFVDDNFGKS